MTVKNYSIPSAVYFIITALLIAYFFPREGKFRYQFHEGKPWRYGLLTAPSNFPIYKTDKEVALEKDSVLKNFKPYYRINKAIESEQIEKLRKAYATTLRKKAGSSYMQYIEQSLNSLYKKGIVSFESLTELNKGNLTEINLVETNISQTHFVSDLFTVKTAYEFIINNCPPKLDKQVLKSCDINNYLTENITYNGDMTAQIKDELLQSVSLASGMVQAGERIVDRGEIIDEYTYNVLRSLKIVYENKTGGNQRQGIILGGQFVLVFGIMCCMWLYLWSFRARIYNNKRSVFFLLLTIIVPCILTELCVTYGLFNVYILPYAIAPIVVRTFFDSRTALFMHLVTVLLCSLMVPFPHEFLLLQTVAGMVVTFSLKELSERSQLIRSSFFIFIAYAVIYLSLSLYQEADFQKINWMMLLYFGINFILLTFAYLLVYMLEKAFGYVSSITLVELSNINNPLLKKLSETCPGTFQHSLQVSILAADAATRVGANAQLVRTGALYHDIGKMSNPAFFTENQSSVNPHEQLSFDESAKVIISHVTEGVKIAEKALLPKAIINFIRTHHGRGKAKYFYNSLKNLHPNQEIDENLFTYPGPNPFTKETAILMMADAVEATSRSLKEYTEKNIHDVVTRIIDGQIADGLLRNTPLTYRDVETIKNVFCEKLKTMYHTRISYPDLKK
ncbi:MAG: HDIG domain-containing protein [Porphyromonadaceae bacterium]|nr:HDIG domain-containing metalloprotein [uncultured Macellibacteroides sp.]MCE5227227.1 HDIG domain-containing protein [Porphyromonadaceae bacterium]